MMERIIVGYTLSPYGVEGYLKVKSTSGEFEHFKRMGEVLLKKNNSERIFEIEDVIYDGWIDRYCCNIFNSCT